jgi:hypothetical protein
VVGQDQLTIGSGADRSTAYRCWVGDGGRKAVTPERLNTVLTRTYAGHVSPNTAQRVGVECAGLGEDSYSPWPAPTSLLRALPPPCGTPRHVPVHQHHTERRVSTTRRASPRVKDKERLIRSCVRCLEAWRPYVRNPMAHGTRCPGPLERVERRRTKVRSCGRTPVSCHRRGGRGDIPKVSAELSVTQILRNG